MVFMKILSDQTILQFCHVNGAPLEKELDGKTPPSRTLAVLILHLATGIPEANPENIRLALLRQQSR